MSTRSFEDSSRPVNPEPPEIKDGEPDEDDDEADDGPLFHVGEVWRLDKFQKRLKASNDTIARMRADGLKVYAPSKKRQLVLIDHLAALIAEKGATKKPPPKGKGK